MQKMPNMHKRFKSQQGAALIAFVLLMIVGSSFLLISKLNAKVRDREDIEKTYESLKRAKEALIGYAVSYPEISVIPPRPGPGYLPCPDRDAPGTAGSGLMGVNAFPPNGGTCSFGGGTSIGRLPYLTIGMPDPFDGSGEVLWYALANDFRHNPINALGTNPNGLNSDAPFLFPLTIDANPNPIVAVIIAPGAALDTPLNNPGGRQARDVSNTLVRNYLEGVNWDITPDFESSNVLANSSNFNDRVIAITRQELMAAVEQRVLGEVAEAVENYRNSEFSVAPSPVPAPGLRAYPWLSPFADPFLVSVFNGVPGTVAGHLPLHWSALVASGPNNSFTAAVNEISYSWNINAGTGIIADITPGPGVSQNTISPNCMENWNCNDLIFGIIPVIRPPAPQICTWTNRNDMNCAAPPIVFSITTAPNACPVNGCNGTCTRTYTLNSINNYLGNGFMSAINVPAPGIRRARDVALTLPLPLAFPIVNPLVTITDTMTGQDPNTAPLCIPIAAPPLTIDSKTISLNGATTGNYITTLPYEIDATGVDIDGDGNYITAGDVAPELPPWFINSNWHQLVYVAYPAVEPQPGITNPFAPGGDDISVCNANCLTLTSTQGGAIGQTNTQARAVVSIAGQDITGNRPTGLISDYFEGVIDVNLDGIDDDEIFDQQLFNLGVYDDQIRIIQTNNNP